MPRETVKIAPAPKPVVLRARKAPTAGPKPSSSARRWAYAALALLLVLVGGAGFAFRHPRTTPATSAAPRVESVVVAVEVNAPAPDGEPTAVTRPAADNGAVAEAAQEEENKRASDKVLLQRKPRVEPRPEIEPVEIKKAPPAPMPAVPVHKVPPVPAGPVNADQARINQAIDNGVRYLRNHPWENPAYAVGYTALAGLTLLECGVPADDPLLQKAAALVRYQAGPLNHTYQIALSILFLDRLGQPEDHRLIQGLGLRLLAGQNAAGGWHYQCPVLGASDMAQLYKFLRSHRPPALQMALQANPPKVALAVMTQAKKTDPFRQFGELVLAKGIEGSTAASVAPAAAANVNEDKKPEPPPAVKAPAPLRPESLPVHLRGLPIVQLQDRSKTGLAQGVDDNSNTQFALLALWAARRHEVPAEQAFLHAQRRFQSSQYPDGRWSYHFQGGHPSVAMTAVGLLGLAMGHGTSALMDEKAAAPPQDLQIQKGLQYLGQFIETAEPRPTLLTPLPNLYFMWSVERVAVLYDLKTISGKDWYRWGSQLLVVHQRGDGSWFAGQYPKSTPHLDTCLALLFLKRSNLVQDLTENLRLYMPIRDSASDANRKAP